MAFLTLHSLRRSFRLFIVATALTLAQGPLAGALQAQSSIASDGDSAAPGYPPADDGVKGWGGGATTPPPAPPAAGPPPPPPPPAVALAVYVAVDGTTTGPFDAEELARMAASGELTESTLVWHEGMADWQPAGEVEALAAILAPAPGPAPTPAPDDEPKSVPGWGPKATPDEGDKAGDGGGDAGDQPAADDQDAGRADPVPPENDTPAAFDPVQYLAGVWQTNDAQIDVPDLGSGTLSGTYTYRSDGTFEFEGRLRVTVNGIPLVINMTGSGTFQAQTLSEGESFTVIPDGQMSMNVPGYPPETEALNDPSSFVVVDENTMRDSDGITWSRRN